LRDEIEFGLIGKLDLRVGIVKEAEKIKKSKKLLKLQVDLGFESRQVVAGISKHFAPEDLVGKRVIVVANLKPAKLMGVESCGMVLAVKEGDKLTLLTTLDEISAGMQAS
jgi:methionyl-tRNA synthetase